MEIDNLLLAWQADEEFVRNTTCWNIAPTKAAEFAPFPLGLPPELEQSLRAQGIPALYSHQAESYRLIENGQHVVIATGTASGKTLCYNLPVLQALLQDSSARALYLFPTKALAQDQLKNLKVLDSNIHAAIYDGDTPTQQRPEIRKNAAILITNPDMLHKGILPHHTLWHQFFRGLRYVVIDEMHSYRGVFGSHVANVIRRLKRIAAFYHAYPQFILTSATIGNPVELATKLIESPVALSIRMGHPTASVTS